jgi:excisionase family DNA binding protein
MKASVSAGQLPQPTATDSSKKRLLDVYEVAAMLGCGRSYVYDLLYRGELRSIKLGRLRRVTLDEVERFIDSKLDHAVGG